MQLVRNDRLVRREARIGGVLLGITFAVLAAGLVLSQWLEQNLATPDTPPWIPIAGSYAVVLVGMGLLFFGNARVRRYGPQYRQDARLLQILKGLDDRFVFFAFLSRSLPDYILVGPGGVWVLVTRLQGGEITCRDNRWSRRSSAISRIFEAMYGTSIGNPSFDATRGVKRVTDELQANLPADSVPEVNGVIVFTVDGARLRIERCSFPVATSKELRRVVGRAEGPPQRNTHCRDSAGARKLEQGLIQLARDLRGSSLDRVPMDGEPTGTSNRSLLEIGHANHLLCELHDVWSGFRALVRRCIHPPAQRPGAGQARRRSPLWLLRRESLSRARRHPGHQPLDRPGRPPGSSSSLVGERPWPA